MPHALLLLLAVSASAPSFAPRPRPYDVRHYRIEMKLEEDGAFDNRVVIALTPKRALSEVELDAYGLTIQSAMVDEQKATFTHRDEPAFDRGTLTIKPVKPLAAGKEAKLSIAYTGKAGTDHRGLFRVKDPDDPTGRPMFFTHFQTNAAQRFFPCNDQPDDKATTELFAIVDGDYTVLSNGTKVLDEAFSDDGRNLRRVHWKLEQPHSTYLLAVAVGAFEPVDVGADVPATIWVPKGKAESAFVAADVTKSALAFQQRFLGVKYPWPKYDQVAVPTFVWGGMENTTLVMMRSNGLVLDAPNHIYGRARIAGLVSHELAHQWFGDYVTCKWWDDTWLNEGFATYLGRLTEDEWYDSDFVEVQGAFYTYASYFRAEDGPRAHPLRPKKAARPEEVFDSISYQKGAHVLRMLETWLGRAEMQKGLKAYLEKHAYGNATSDDFFAAVGDATRKAGELKAFKQSWLEKKGYPVLFPTWTFEGGTVTVTIRQEPNHADEKGPFVFKLPVVFHRQSQPAFHEERLIVVDKPTVTARFSLPASPEWVNWNKGSSALARINVAAVGEQEWVRGARGDPDPVWRAISTFALMGEMGNPDAREQTLPTDAAMGAILDVLSTDASPYVRDVAMQRLLLSKWKRLPKQLGPAVLELAKNPKNLPEDGFGRIRVRRSALELLGKLDYAEGREYLLAQLSERDIDLNYLPAIAAGVARLGDSMALATLGAAVNQQRSRGYAYFRSAAEALGAFESPEVVPALRDLFQKAKGNEELARAVMDRLDDNHTVKHSTEGAALVRDLVLSQDWGLQLRAWMLRLLDDVKTKDARDALMAVVEKSDSDWLKGSAKEVLAKNFPAPEPPKAKGKKK